MMAVEVHRGVEGRAPDGREHSPFSLAGLTLQAGPVAHRGAVFAGVPRRGRGGGPPARRLGSWPAADRAGDRCRSVDACAVGSPGRPPVLRAVTVVPDPEATATSPQPVLVAPSGFRVEG